MTVTVNVPKVGVFDVEIRLPEVSRARMVTTTSLASVFTGLWIGAPAFLPFAEVDAKLALCGFAVPFGVGYVTLLLAERRARRDLTAAARQRLINGLPGGER